LANNVEISFYFHTSLHSRQITYIPFKSKLFTQVLWKVLHCVIAPPLPLDPSTHIHDKSRDLCGTIYSIPARFPRSQFGSEQPPFRFEFGFVLSISVLFCSPGSERKLKVRKGQRAKGDGRWAIGPTSGRGSRPLERLIWQLRAQLQFALASVFSCCCFYLSLGSWRTSSRCGFQRGGCGHGDPLQQPLPHDIL